MTKKPKTPRRPPSADRPRSASVIAAATHKLFHAAYHADTAAAKSALADGADETAFSPAGLTALHLAISTNNLSLVRELIEKWDAPIVPDRFGRSPTTLACACGAGTKLIEYISVREQGPYEEDELIDSDQPLTSLDDKPFDS